VKQHTGPAGRLATLRGLAQRFAFLALVVTSFGLMAIGKADIYLIERSRTLVVDAVSPILDALSRPAATIADFVEQFRSMANLRAENLRLAEENARLMHWQTVARQLEFENASLRTQMNFIPDPDPAFITARVVGDPGGTYVNSVLINAGSRDGVRKGQAVLSGEVLVGRVAEVGLRSSRILLVTDLNARIPVVVESTRARGIMSGENNARPKLGYLSAATGDISVGDRIVTSAHGSAFPPGIPVGVVSSINDGIIRVEPFLLRHQLEIVTVVDFGMGGILSGETSREGNVR
jgi:rod shape-determining protein MreC